MNKHIEQKALSLLEYTRCLKFPIDIYEIAQLRHYIIKSYQKCQKFIETLGLTEYAKTHQAFSIKHKNNIYILVSDKLSTDEERKTIAHELGHIVLHNIGGNNIFGENDSFDSQKSEKEANEFALILLAPLPLISSFHIKNAEDIKQITRLSLSDSEIIYQNMLNYREECCSILERDKIKNRYIRQSKQRDTLLKISLSLSCFLTVALVISILFILFQPEQTKTVSVSNNSQINNSTYNATSSNELKINDTYYWTEGGRVFHIYRDCQSLKNSSEIHSGTLDEAEREKDRLCKFCEDRNK